MKEINKKISNASLKMVFLYSLQVWELMDFNYRQPNCRWESDKDGKRLTEDETSLFTSNRRE